VGDLFAGGGTVIVSGPVDADLVAGGGTVTVLGAVGDDLRIGGGNVLLQGTIGDDALVGGGTIELRGPVGGDAWLFGGSVSIEAPIGGDARFFGGSIYINAPIAGSVEVEAEELVLGPQARLAGDLLYRSPQEAEFETGAQVAGAVSYEPREVHGAGEAFAAFATLAALAQLLMLLAGSFFFLLVFRRYVELLVAAAFARPLAEVARGVVLLIGLPIASILLFVTVIGIPLGIIGLASFVALMVFASLMAPLLLGVLLYKWFSRSEGYTLSWKSALLGVFAYFVLGLVPLLGWLIQLGFILLSLGATIKLKWDMAKEWR
jgi:hypothetical protein